MQAIAIFGAPRSGTSWLGQIFNSSPYVAYRFQPLFSYAFKERLTLRSRSEEIDAFHRDLLTTEDSFVLQLENISGHPTPAFRKSSITHLVWKEVRYHYIIEHIIKNSGIQIIGIVRHPCAVINSWLQASKEFDDRWNPVEEWRYAEKKNQHKPEEYNGYEKWKELTFMFLELERKYESQFSIQLYEQLNDNTEAAAKKLFDSVNLPFTSQTTAFIQESKSVEMNNDVYGVYRKDQNSQKWQHELANEIQESILNDPDFIALNERFKWH